MEKKTKKKLSRNAQRMIQIYGEDLCFKALELFGNGENITTYQVGRELGVKSNTAWSYNFV